MSAPLFGRRLLAERLARGREGFARRLDAALADLESARAVTAAMLESAWAHAFEARLWFKQGRLEETLASMRR